MEAQDRMYDRPQDIHTEPGSYDAFVYYHDGSLYHWDDEDSVMKGAEPRVTLDITPTTEHLITAVIEKGCRRVFVRRLLLARDVHADIETINFNDSKSYHGLSSAIVRTTEKAAGFSISSSGVLNCTRSAQSSSVQRDTLSRKSRSTLRLILVSFLDTQRSSI